MSATFHCTALPAMGLLLVFGALCTVASATTRQFRTPTKGPAGFWSPVDTVHTPQKLQQHQQQQQLVLRHPTEEQDQLDELQDGVQPWVRPQDSGGSVDEWRQKRLFLLPKPVYGRSERDLRHQFEPKVSPSFVLVFCLRKLFKILLIRKYKILKIFAIQTKERNLLFNFS